MKSPKKLTKSVSIVGPNQESLEDFPGDPMVKNLPANAEDMSSILWVQKDPTVKPMHHN